MVESIERFGRLIDDWGPWGLAYLEAVFKAADGIASDEAEKRGLLAEEQTDDERE